MNCNHIYHRTSYILVTDSEIFKRKNSQLKPTLNLLPPNKAQVHPIGQIVKEEEREKRGDKGGELKGRGEWKGKWRTWLGFEKIKRVTEKNAGGRIKIRRYWGNLRDIVKIGKLKRIIELRENGFGGIWG